MRLEYVLDMLTWYHNHLAKIYVLISEHGKYCSTDVHACVPTYIPSVLVWLPTTVGEGNNRWLS